MRPVLEGVRVIELAGIGPAPFCGTMLADHGAEVIRVDRPDGSDPLSQDQGRDVLLRSRRSITLDLKRPQAVAMASDEGAACRDFRRRTPRDLDRGAAG